MIRQSRIISLLLTLGLSAPAACQTTGCVVARYDGATVTSDDLRHIARVSVYPQADPVAAYLSASSPGEREEAKSYVQKGVEEIVWGRRYSPLAKAGGTSVPQDMVGRIEALYQDCVGNSRDTQIREQASAEAARDLPATFARLGEQLAAPELREVAYIFREIATTASAEVKAEKLKRLEAVRSEILAGKLSFADAARLYSEAPSARIGGSLGVVSRDNKFNPRFKDFVFSVPAGQVSAVTMLHNGYYMVFVRSARPAFKPTLADVESSAALRQTLLSLAGQTSVSAALSAALQSFPDSQSDNQALGRAALKQGSSDPDCAAVRDLALQQLLASQYFLARRETEFKPSEQEIRDYYQSHLPEMFEEGIMLLTRYTIPVSGERDAVVKTRDEASSIAEQVRSAVLAGETTTALENRFTSDGLVISSSKGWIQGSGDGPTDADLNRLAAGQLSKVHIVQDGASFYRLDARREMPTAPLEKKRDNIEALLAREKFERAYAAERAAVMRQLGVEIVWDKMGK